MISGREEAIAPLRNYLQDVPDLSLVRTPSARRRTQKNNMLISGQFSETFSTSTLRLSGIFLLKDLGDIDIRDSIHSDRILMVMIPALDTSAHTGLSWDGMFITQKSSMILARDLGLPPRRN